MASWVFCNRCFQPPQRTSRFSLTSCGHVYCHPCLGEGKPDECAICRAPCRAVPLSQHTGPDIQALFLRVDTLCARYSRDTAQISEFQEQHRRRLQAFYREKIRRLEDALRTPALQVQRLQRAESVDVDPAPAPVRRPEAAAGPARISLISPPQDGRMGSVCPRGTWHPDCTPARPALPPTLRVAARSRTPAQLPGRLGAATSPRPPISISGLLQRQRGGPAPRR